MLLCLDRFVCSLAEFAGDLEEGSLLCLVLALRAYLERTKSFPARAATLFVSPRSMSKNAVSYFLREVISGAGAVRGDEGLTAFVVSLPLPCSCRAGRSLRCWRLHLGDQTQFFDSFYFKDIHYIFEGIRFLGPFIAA